MRKTIVVLKSPFRCDYQDGNDPPPWEYSVSDFKSWVYEVLLDCGKFGRYPKSAAEAIEVAEGSKYTIEVK